VVLGGYLLADWYSWISCLGFASVVSAGCRDATVPNIFQWFSTSDDGRKVQAFLFFRVWLVEEKEENSRVAGSLL